MYKMVSKVPVHCLVASQRRKTRRKPPIKEGVSSVSVFVQSHYLQKCRLARCPGIHPLTVSAPEKMEEGERKGGGRRERWKEGRGEEGRKEERGGEGRENGRGGERRGQ